MRVRDVVAVVEETLSFDCSTVPTISMNSNNIPEPGATSFLVGTYDEASHDALVFHDTHFPSFSSLSLCTHLVPFDPPKKKCRS